MCKDRPGSCAASATAGSRTCAAAQRGTPFCVEGTHGPHEEGDAVRVRGRAVDTAAGAPDLAFELETERFAGDRICHLATSMRPRSGSASTPGSPRTATRSDST